MEITILHNQSLFDIAIQHTGSVENAFAIAKANDRSITAILTSGSKITIPSGVKMNNDVKDYYAARKVQPATGIDNDNKIAPAEYEGISYWIINQNFVVQ